MIRSTPQAEKKKIRLGSTRFVVAAALVLFVLGVGAGRYDWLAIDKLAAGVKQLRKGFEVRKDGEEGVAQNVWDSLFGKRPAIDSTGRNIDTSRIPLLLHTVPLGRDGDFAIGGGAITLVDDSLLLMDWLGNIFAYQNGSLKKLELGEFPNNLKHFTSKSMFERRGPSLRTHYLTYDSVRGTLYASFEKYDPAAKGVRFAISAITIDNRTMRKTTEWRTIFESVETVSGEAYGGSSSGGRMVIAGDRLFFSVGDYNVGTVPQLDADAVSQNPRSSLGKIFEYDIATKKLRLKSAGFRNVQGLTVTREGQLISAEHGPEGGDEINIIRDGGNYGWPYRTYGTQYGTFTWPIKLSPPDIDFIEPIFAWVPSVAISPLIQVIGFDQSWDGDLIAGSLKGRSLYRIRLSGGRVMYCEPIWIGQRIRDIVQWRGQIVLMTDAPSLIFVSVDPARVKANRKSQNAVETGREAKF